MLLVLSTGLFEGKPLAGLIPRIREAGFKRLEAVDDGQFDEGPEASADVARRAREYDVEIPNWHLIQESPFSESRQAGRAAIERMKNSMERGVRVGAKNHVVHWYHRFRDRGCDALWREIVDEWADHARRLGVRLLMETVPDKPSNERYVPAAEIMEFVESYPPEVLSICVDVNHSNLKEELSDVVRVVGKRLVSIHVSDNDGRSERHWLPGQGVIDFPALFESLESAAFDGLIVLEVGKWCRSPDSPLALNRLHAFGMSLLTEGKTHPETPPLLEENPAY